MKSNVVITPYFKGSHVLGDGSIWKSPNGASRNSIYGIVWKIPLPRRYFPFQDFGSRVRSGSDDSELFRLLSQKREAFEGGGTNSAVDSPGSRQGIYRRFVDTVPRRSDMRDGSVGILRGNSRSEAVIEKLFGQTCGNGTLPLFEYRLRNGSRIPELDEIPYRKGSGDDQRVDFRFGHHGGITAFGVFDSPVDADSVLMERGIRKKLERDGS